MTNETKELKTYTMQELYEHPLEPMACLVDGLLAPGLYILGGSPKVGKSWMALQLCLAVRLADTAAFRRQKRPVPCNRMERGDALWIRPGGVVPARPSG